jgi:hypothetical protein
MRPGSASANASRQTRIWHRTEVITAAPPATVPRIAIIIITDGAGDPDPRQHHPLSRPLAAHATVSTLLLLIALRGAQRQHQPHRQDHPVTLTLARNRNAEQADMRYDTVPARITLRNRQRSFVSMAPWLRPS